MERLGSTFGSYRIHQAVLVGTAWTMYRASSSHGTRVVYRGVSSTASRTSSLWVSDVLPDIGAVIPMFLQQVSKSNELGHPVIPRILDMGERDGRVYFATQYQEGATLEEHIRRHGRLSVRDAVSLLTPIADCLDYAHNVGLIHGAIGPNMIWIDATDDPNQTSAMLTGFGLDALLRSYVLTGQRNDAIPDVLYVAPEQLRRSSDGNTDEYVLRFSNPEQSVDQYALACALSHCVTGHPPFRGESMATLFNAHAHAKAPSAEVGGDTAARAIAVGMAKEPSDRHPSCLDLMHATRSDHESQPLTANGGGRSGLGQHTLTGRSQSTATMPSYAPAANRPSGNSRPRTPEGSSRVGTWVGFALVASLLVVTMVLLFMATSTFFNP